MAKINTLLYGPNMDIETLQLQVDNLPSHTYKIFIPSGYEFGLDNKVLVCIHGISRKSTEQIELLIKGAKANNTIVIAPLFSKHYHPSYQRHKVGKDWFRSDEVLNNIIADVEKRFYLHIKQFDLFGFSGGAQFAHRYALRYPKKISKLICCAAGWYTFPDLQLAFPYGLASSDDAQFMFNVSEVQLADFLKIPITIAVGEEDTQSDSSLNRTNKINKQQGFNRVERAARWANSLLKQSNRLELDSQLQFILLPKSGHSFAECMSYGMLASYIF